jgi:F-box protein 11
VETTHEKTRATFQEQLDGTLRGHTVRLAPQEYPGPVTITSPLTLDGQNATVWALKGPVVSIYSADVTLRNLRIEVTDNSAASGSEEACAILVQSGRKVRLENVEVRGSVIGLVEEEGIWRYPNGLVIGLLETGVEHHFTLRLAVPVPCKITSNISGVEVEPRQLNPGPQEVRLTIESLYPDTLLSGSLSLTSASLKRFIGFSAYTLPTNSKLPPATPRNTTLIWQPSDWEALTGDPAAMTQTVEAPPLESQTDSSPETAPPTLPISPPEGEQVSTPPQTPTEDSQEETQKSDRVDSKTVPLAPAVMVVSRQGDGEFSTIGEAISNARSGVRILVKPGLYTEGLLLDRRVEIVGDGPAAKIIVECGNANCLRMETEQTVVVRGLTLRGAAVRTGPDRHTVHILQGKLILEDCDITSNSLSGIAVAGPTAGPIIRRCKVHGSKTAGVLFYGKGQGVLEECEIFENTLAGVEIRQGSTPILRNCTIRDGKQCGILVHESGLGSIEDCDISGNALAGVEIKQGGNPHLRRCRIHDGKYPGVRVLDQGQGTLEECDIFGNTLSGVEIRQRGNPAIRRCKIHDGKQAGLLFVRDAQGTVVDCEIFGNAQSGLEIKQTSNPVIRQCKIHDNLQAGAIVHDKGKGILEDCDIWNHAVLGVKIRRGGNPVLRQCKIRNCQQFGLLVHDDGQGTVEECEIFDIDWSGVAITGGGNPSIRNCKIHDAKHAGVVVWQEGVGTLEDCEIQGNTVAGVAIRQGGKPIVRRCNIQRNGDVALWAQDQAAGRVEDCDLSENKWGPHDIHSGCAVTLQSNKSESS